MSNRRVNVYAQDTWQFADEDEAVPTWADDIKAQAPELAMFTAFATLALVSFFRKSERLKWITMGASVVYLGFVRSQLITVVNIFALTKWNLPSFRQNLPWYLFAIFTRRDDGSVGSFVLWAHLRVRIDDAASR